MTLFQLTGRVALITGVREGIGAEIARIFSGAGAALMLANRSLPEAERIAAGLRNEGRHALSTGFTATRAGADAAVGAAIRAFGALDIIVHNAGGCPWTSLDRLSDDVLEAYGRRAATAGPHRGGRN